MTETIEETIQISVELDLKSKSGHTIDYKQLLLDHGYSKTTEPTTTDQESEDGSKKKKKRLVMDDEYDYDDAFIDDKDLNFRAQDEFQTEKRAWNYGFFVCSGSLDDVLGSGLLQDDQKKRKAKEKKSPKKEMLKPIEKRKSEEKPESPSKKPKTEKKKLLMTGPLPLKLENYYNEYKKKSLTETFQDKKQFPTELKAILRKLVNLAHSINEINDNFIAHVMDPIPYNSVTVRNLVSRLIIPDKIEKRKAEIKQLYKQIKAETRLLEADFKWKPELKQLILQLIQYETESIQLEIELAEILGKSANLNPEETKQACISKIVSYFPSGTVTTDDLLVKIK